MIFILVLSENEGIIFAAVYEKHSDRMMRDAQEFFGADLAEDIIHDIFIKLMEAFDDDRNSGLDSLDEKPKSFFSTVVRNHSINVKNKEKTAKKHMEIEYSDDLDVFPDDISLTPEKMLTRAETKEILDKHLDFLSPKTRCLITDKFYYDITNKQLAKLYDMTETAVSSRVNRALDTLRSTVKKEGIIVEN